MSRSLWRCRHTACPIRGGAILGRVTAEGGLILDPAVVGFRIFMDTRRSIVLCPACGVEREFRGEGIFSHSASVTTATR